MPSRTKRFVGASFETPTLNLLIVARDQRELYRRLQRRLNHCAVVTMIFDRRERERRQIVQAVPVDRRRGARRAALHVENDLRQRKYIFARPQARCPHA